MMQQPRSSRPRGTSLPRGAWLIALLHATPLLHAHDEPELTSHLRFEGTTFDGSGNGNDGTLVGTSGVYVSAAIHGQPDLGVALRLDGDDDSLTLDTVAGDFANAPHFSLGIWVRTPSSGGILSVTSSSGTPKLAITLNGSGRAVVSQGTTPLATSTSSVANDLWHHLALVIDVTGMGASQLYLDGALDQTFVSPPISFATTDHWSLGRAGSLHLDGLIDDARLFHGLLDAGDVSAIKGHPDDDAKEGEHALLFQLVPVDAATHQTIASGAWSNPATWEGGLLPTNNAQVVITKGTVVTYDVNNVADELRWLRVDGELHFDPTVNTTLRVDTFVVDTGGYLTLGTMTAPILPDVSARILINSDGPIDRDWDPIELSRGLITHGRFEAHGAIKTPYATLTGALAGATTLQLDAPPSGWEVGDTLVLAGTYATYTGNDDDNSRFHDEVLRVTSINGNSIGFQNITNSAAVTTSPNALLWNHAPPPGYDLRIHVANMTRNVVIETENFAALTNSVDVKRRGHVMLMHSDKADVRYIASIGNGRTDKSTLLVDSQLDDDGELIVGTGTNQRGRYALHLHRLGPNKPTPVQIVGNAIWTSPGWGFVHHDSHADVTDNVAFDVDGAAFVLEDGTERGSMRRNLAIKNRGDGDPGMDIEVSPRTPLFDLGFNGHGFWIQGGGGPEITDNISASAFGTAFFVHSNDDLLPGPNHPNVIAGLQEAQPENIATEFLAYPEIAGGADEVSVAAIPLRKLSGLIAYNATRGLMTWMHMRNGDGIGDFSLPEAAAFPHNRLAVIEDFQFFALRLNGINNSYTSQVIYRDGLILGDVDDQIPGEGWPADRLENGYSFPSGLVRPAIIGNQEAGDQMTFENLRIEGWQLGLMIPHTGPAFTMDEDVSYVASRLVGGHFDHNAQHLFPQTTGTSNSQQAYWVREFTPFFKIEGNPYFGTSTPNQSPIANWTSSPAGGLAVTFDASASNDDDGIPPSGLGVDSGNAIAAYAWDFGDGSPLGFGRTTSHVYTTPGSYPVILTVYDKQGSRGTSGANLWVMPSAYPNLIVDSGFDDPTPFPSYQPWEFVSGSVLIAELDGDWTTTNASSITRTNGRAEVTGPIGTATYQRHFLHQMHQDDYVRRGEQRLHFDATNLGPGGATTTLEVLIHGANGEFDLPYVPNTPLVPTMNGDDAFDTDILFYENFGGSPFDTSFDRMIDFGDGYQFIVVTVLIGSVNPAAGDVVAIDNFSLSADDTAETMLASLFVTPEPAAATLHWTTSFEGSVSSYRVDVASALTGIFSAVASLPSQGGATPNDYQATAISLLPGSSYELRLIEVRSDGSEALLGMLDVVPLAPGDPTNVLDVGPTGTHATLQAAINATLAPDTVIRVAPGTYAAFSVGPGASGGLRIVGASPGTVMIDTTVMPVLIHDLAASGYVELSNLTIGQATSLHEAVIVRDCAGLVLLDQVSAEGGNNHHAIDIERSGAVVMQRSTLIANGGSSLRVAEQSTATISDSTAGNVEVVTHSMLTTCELSSNGVTVTTGASTTEYSGAMPMLDLVEFISLSSPLALSFEGSPIATWFLVASDRYERTELAGVEMPLLLRLPTLKILDTRVTNANGDDVFAIFIPQVATLVGYTFPFQAGHVDPSSGTIRLSNTDGLTILP